MLSAHSHIAIMIVGAFFTMQSSLLTAAETNVTNNKDSLIVVQFIEGAPKDRFKVTNKTMCTLTNVELTIDLKNTVGSLIFDTTATGAGVEVFQPFAAATGNPELVGESEILDGQQRLTVSVLSFKPKETFAFTLDVDDTLNNGELGQIRVADSEIKGGVAILTADAINDQRGVFNDNAAINLLLTSCPT